MREPDSESGDRAGRDAADELAFHIAMAARALEAEGVPPEEANRRAEARFDDLANLERELTLMDARAERRAALGMRLEWLGADLRHGFRLFRRRPLAALVSVITLGLGIGGTAVMAVAAWGLLVAPLPYPEPDRLVGFWSAGNWSPAEFDVASEAVDWAQLAAWSATRTTVRRSADAAHVVATVQATDGLFDVLGVAAARGRGLRRGDGVPGAEPVVVLSDGLWRDAFGGAADMVGMTVLIDGLPRTVVGVMPAGFGFPDDDVRLWLPVTIDAAAADYSGNHYLALAGRLHAGVTHDAAAARLPRLADALRARFRYGAQFDKPGGAAIEPLKTHLGGAAGPSVGLLGGTMLMVLLIAAANVAGVQLGRLTERRDELAVRTALGAGRRRLAAQLLAEGLLIGSLGGLCGVGVVLFAATTTLPESDSIRAAPVAIALSVAMLSILAGLAIGALPAMRATRSAASVSGVRGHAGGTAHGLLVAGELAVSVPLVLGAALLLSSFARLRSVDTGLDARGVLAIDVLAGDGDLDVEARRAFLLAATERLAALPGIAGAASVQMLPLRERGWSVSVTTPDRPDLTGERRPVFYFRAITPAFHDVLGIRIVEGRGVRPEDSGSSRPVAVVGMALARTLWPDGSAVGRTLRTGVDGDTDIEVVGVAEDIHVSGVRSAPDPVVYRPVAQVRYVPEGQTLVVKVDADPAAAVPVIRAALEATDRRVAIARIETFDSVVRAAIGDVTRASVFVTASALLALILGGLGVYGVASQLVARRTPEFGVRMALGATPAQVFGTVLRNALTLIALGLATGGLLFVFLARFLRTLLFDVRPGEPAVVIVCAGVLAGAAFVALTAPAVRAARTDPAAALRGD